MQINKYINAIECHVATTSQINTGKYLLKNSVSKGAKKYFRVKRTLNSRRTSQLRTSEQANKQIHEYTIRNTGQLNSRACCWPMFVMHPIFQGQFNNFKEF